MNIRNLLGAVFFACLLSSCTTSPMQARLDRNFIYNCSLQLIEKKVPALEAERVCSSSHHAEMSEQDRAALAKEARFPAAKVEREPASVK